MATERHKKPENYLSAVAEHGHGIKHDRLLSAGEQASEALLMGLRLAEGVDLSALDARFGIPSTDLIKADRLALHSDLGLLKCAGNRITVTPAGMPLLDALLGEIVADGLVTA